jgi:hypothetical protein
MRAGYPAWAYVVPKAPYRHITSLVLVAAAVGAIGSAEVVLSLANDPRTATETSSAPVPAIVIREPAARVRTVVQARPKRAQLPPSEIEQMPQPVPDLAASNRATAAMDGGGQVVLPDDQTIQNDLPAATHRRLHWRRFGRFPTPNHW